MNKFENILDEEFSSLSRLNFIVQGLGILIKFYWEHSSIETSVMKAPNVNLPLSQENPPKPVRFFAKEL